MSIAYFFSSDFYTHFSIQKKLIISFLFLVHTTISYKLLQIEIRIQYQLSPLLFFVSKKVLNQGFHLNTPMLLPMGMVILSMMFLASLGKKKESEESVVHSSVEIVSPPIKIFEGPPLIPYDVPNPGQPGGGYEPHPDHHYKILSLVPYGLIPLAVFPNLYRGGNPSECVIFSEPDPVILPSPPPHIPIPPPLPPYYSPYSSPYYDHRRRKKTHDRKDTQKFVKMKKQQQRNKRQIPIDHRLYGFRCLVTIIDKKSCSTYKECKDIKEHEARYGQGYFFQPTTTTTKSTQMNQNFKNNPELPQVTSVSQLYPPIFHTHFKRQLGINYDPAAASSSSNDYMSL